jgi:hypothetical protein
MAFLARRFARQGNANELRDTLGQESRQLGLAGAASATCLAVYSTRTAMAGWMRAIC